MPRVVPAQPSSDEKHGFRENVVWEQMLIHSSQGVRLKMNPVRAI